MAKDTTSLNSIQSAVLSSHASSLNNLSKKEQTTLEKWAESVTSPLQNQHSTELLSRFGLKNAQDVIVFLKSPEGQSLKAKIGAELYEQAAMQEELKLQRQEQLILSHRLKAILFLWLIEKETHAAERVKDLELLQQEKTLHPTKSTVTEPNPQAKQYSDLEKTVKQYDQAIKQVELQRTDNASQAELLIKQLQQLVVEEKRIIHKYSVYEKNLEVFDNLTKSTAALSPKKIESKIKKLSDEMTRNTDKISALLEKGDDDAAYALMAKQNGLNLQAASLLDLLDVMNGKKYFADEEGNPIDWSNNKNLTPTYILKIDQENSDHLNNRQQVIKDKETGKFYLLQPGQKWDFVKTDSVAKKEAEASYERRKPEIMNVKTLVKNNQGLENQFQASRAGLVNDNLLKNKQEKIDLDKNLEMLNAARASAQQALNQLSPKPSPKNKTEQVTQQAPTFVMKDAMAKFRQSGTTVNATPAELFAFAEQTPQAYRSSINEYLNKNLAKMPRTTPVPTLTMQSFLKFMEQYGVNTSNPGMAAPKAVEQPSPSPFRTKPTPF